MTFQEGERVFDEKRGYGTIQLLDEGWKVSVQWDNSPILEAIPWDDAIRRLQKT